ncbi:DUF6538 domain-containing protein [Bradyrhizobium sp. AUGA SZCCT0283]|uniref:DUF6538 domain-containing protein n=1 Tax=Bradyrhizobium sp. AUGA SZCCT0283 TaxID=2807671 RepID=UPI003907F6A5
MTRPQKHPDSGYYWFRKRVPDDLRSLIGRREEKVSLGTRDPIEAKRLHALKLAEVEERWANLRAGQRPLSPDDIARLASEIGEQLRRQLEADPYQPLRWDVEIGARLWTASDTQDVYTDITQPLSPADRKRLDQQNMPSTLLAPTSSFPSSGTRRQTGAAARGQCGRAVRVRTAGRHVARGADCGAGALPADRLLMTIGAVFQSISSDTASSGKRTGSTTGSKS